MKSSFPLPDLVLKDVRASAPREVLRQLADALERREGVEAAGLTMALMDAEAQGGSTIGDGIAVVSTRVPARLSPRRLCGFALLAKPVSFRGVENHPCDLVFVMISPDTEGQAHLRDLSSLIRALRDRDFVDRLRAVPTAERALSLFRARDMALIQAA